MIGIPLHSWLCAEKCGPTEPNRAQFVALCGKPRTWVARTRVARAIGRAVYEVQARHKRAYSPSAATKS
jgi:hypothetical protein